ncbi:hypothetical protein PILCRDRAFT_691268 [Piloderma croceum F 1598]|uniref:Uncharacterized protein n=1 Tax=Piloderma croceum (strain F 1598) TaxID=765440 RepID=A0A0C3EQQ2_PILCF|nr:hypothetical protein PILCRDRAFT_691268 [Piloderma croceum F 1598]
MDTDAEETNSIPNDCNPVVLAAKDVAYHHDGVVKHILVAFYLAIRHVDYDLSICSPGCRLITFSKAISTCADHKNNMTLMSLT